MSQYDKIRLDERNRYATSVRVQRINDQTNPDLTQSISVVERSTRVFYVHSFAELNTLTAEYINELDLGNMVLMVDIAAGVTRMFVWTGPVTQWHEMVIGSGATGVDLFSFLTNNIKVTENGSVIHTVKLDWDYDVNAEVTSQVIDHGVGVIDINTRSIAISGLNLTEDTPFVLTAATERSSISKTTTVYFRDKIYTGVSDKATIILPDIRQMEDELTTKKYITKEFDCNDQYIYMVLPTSIGEPEFLVNEFYTNAWHVAPINITNEHGYTAEYKIYRSKDKYFAKNIRINIEFINGINHEG